MTITFFHFPAPGMGSLLKDSFGKEVGKRKWCETFAGPLIRRLSRSGGLSFIFSKEMLIFCVFFGAFRALPSTKKNTKTHQKKHNSYHKKTPWKKKRKSYHKKTPIHITKEIKKHKSYQKKHQKQTQFIPQKNTKKTKSFSFLFLLQFLFFFCFFSVFFLFFFCFFSAFGKLLLLKHFQVASPAQFQPPLQPASPPGL